MSSEVDIDIFVQPTLYKEYSLKCEKNKYMVYSNNNTLFSALERYCNVYFTQFISKELGTLSLRTNLIELPDGTYFHYYHHCCPYNYKQKNYYWFGKYILQPPIIGEGIVDKWTVFNDRTKQFISIRIGTEIYVLRLLNDNQNATTGNALQKTDNDGILAYQILKPESELKPFSGNLSNYHLTEISDISEMFCDLVQEIDTLTMSFNQFKNFSVYHNEYELKTLIVLMNYLCILIIVLILLSVSWCALKIVRHILVLKKKKENKKLQKSQTVSSKDLGIDNSTDNEISNYEEILYKVSENSSSNIPDKFNLRNEYVKDNILYR